MTRQQKTDKKSSLKIVQAHVHKDLYLQAKIAIAKRGVTWKSFITKALEDLVRTTK